MKNLTTLEKYRLRKDELAYYGACGDSGNGMFKIYIEGRSFLCIASNGGGWEHVSVSPRNQKRCPSWDEMCAVKALFFEDEETVVQFHPPKSDYVNNYQYCLRLWRPSREDIPRPPTAFV